MHVVGPPLAPGPSSTNGNRIGPGNTIAHSTGDGVAVDARLGPASGNRIVANSIFDSGNGGGTGVGGGPALGIALVGGANKKITAPAITSFVGGKLVGTVTGNPNS